ncbi:hypothetical protein C8R45DRAFT_638685, partial [Mycena sanguinolenta]
TCAAYWSLDSSGTARLSVEEATRLGFPAFELSATSFGRFWDASVYEGLRQFHQAKGFDPYSQDLAQHLEVPLYQVSCQVETPSASVNSEDEDFDADIDSGGNSAYPGDYESVYPPTLTADDSAVDAESASHSEEDVHDPAGGSCGSEHQEGLNCESHDVSESDVEEDMVAEEIMFAPSRSFNVLMSIQLMSILFLGLSWVYDLV